MKRYVPDEILAAMEQELATGQTVIDVDSLKVADPEKANIRKAMQEWKEAQKAVSKPEKNGSSEINSAPAIKLADPEEEANKSANLTVGVLIEDARKYGLDAREIERLKSLGSDIIVTNGIINRYINKKNRTAIRSAAGLN